MAFFFASMTGEGEMAGETRNFMGGFSTSLRESSYYLSIQLPGSPGKTNCPETPVEHTGYR